MTEPSIEVMLIVELDGPIHQYTQEQDRVRQAFLESLGYEVLRFANMEVFTNVRAVLDVIEAAVQRRKPLPSPPQGEGRKPLPGPPQGEGAVTG